MPRLQGHRQDSGCNQDRRARHAPLFLLSRHGPDHLHPNRVGVMTQPRYLVRNRYDRQIVQAHMLRINWKVIYTRTPTSYGGSHLEDSGKRDKTKIEVRPRGRREDGTLLIKANGDRTEQVNWAEEMSRTAADV